MSNRESFGKKIVRTGAGLRDSLYEQMERLRDGSVEPQEAAAFANLASVIVKSAQVEISYYKARKAGDIPQDAEVGLVGKQEAVAQLPAPAKQEVAAKKP